ncbi:MAG: hypothetical protein M1415_10045, partial [Firmicutes bacterium]|nr:hypothetical protein [Bacillota bacterium]
DHMLAQLTINLIDRDGIVTVAPVTLEVEFSGAHHATARGLDDTATDGRPFGETGRRGHRPSLGPDSLLGSDCGSRHPRRSPMIDAIDHGADHRWREAHSGKPVLFTDRDDWSTTNMIARHRDAWHVEHIFRDIQCTPWVHSPPQFHWTG